MGRFAGFPDWEPKPTTLDTGTDWQELQTQSLIGTFNIGDTAYPSAKFTIINGSSRLILAGIEVGTGPHPRAEATRIGETTLRVYKDDDSLIEITGVNFDEPITFHGEGKSEIEGGVLQTFLDARYEAAT